MNFQTRNRLVAAALALLAAVVIVGAVLTLTGSPARTPHQTQPSKTATPSTPTPVIRGTSRFVSVPPLTDHPAATPVQAEYDAALASGLGSSTGLEVAEAAQVPSPGFSQAWPARPVANTPEEWAETFTAELLDIDFARQSRAGLGAWLSAEEAPELLPGVPTSVQGKVLYLSLFDATALGSSTPVPNQATWAADARAGVTWKVSDLLVQTDPQYSQIVASGWQPVDQRFTVEDVSGLLTATKGGTSTRRRFSMGVYLGSAHWHPGYGTVLVDDWKET